MRIILVLSLGFLSGCSTMTPGQTAAIVAGAIGAAIILSDSDEDTKDEEQCYILVAPDGSTPVCR